VHDETDIEGRFTDDPQVLAAAEREARAQGWHQGANQTVIGIGPVPWWLRRPATKPEILALLAELDAQGPGRWTASGRSRE
jgi:hypothetical protein